MAPLIVEGLATLYSDADGDGGTEGVGTGVTVWGDAAG